MVISVVPDARKGGLQWLRRGVSSHASRIYCRSLGRRKSVAICGYPRSGTTWISAILSDYYALPAPRHYGWPQFYPQILHGHDLRLGQIHRIFYMVRSPYDVFPSLYVKRYGVTIPGSSDRALFKAFLQKELSQPYEAPCVWADHVAAAARRFGPEALLTYSRNSAVIADRLSRRIERIDGRCDHNRLTELSKRTDIPTTLSSSAARRFNWFTTECHEMIQAELQRLNTLMADARFSEKLGLQ